MAITIPTYPGSSSFFPGDTSFGFYDYEPSFQRDVEKVADWCAKRLGFPLMEVELQDKHFFNAFEEAITEYTHQINSYQGRDNILSLFGLPTGSANLADTYIEPTLQGDIRLARAYGSEVGSGGTLTWYTGSIEIRENKQVYNLLTDATLEHGDMETDNITIRKIYHFTPPTTGRHMDPTGGGGIDTQAMLGSFGWGGMAVGASFLMTPIHYDILRMQAIEFNQLVRKSGYGFQLTNNRLRIFPQPMYDYTLWFSYTIDNQNILETDALLSAADKKGKITNHSNIPYFNFKYAHINDMGKRWIRKYALAVAKEMLGQVRGKYQSVPIPDNEVTLNGADLLQQSADEKTTLIEELTTMLDQYSTQAQLERKLAEAQSLMDRLKMIPMKIYVK
jgi:hypothetical protein